MAKKFEGHGRLRLAGDLQLETLGGVARESAGEIFVVVADAIAVEVAVLRDQVDVPAGTARHAAGLIEHPLLHASGSRRGWCRRRG